mmetsp:Transcript_3879/g.12310  ORF Transcript_3879/g.12310 Transcript_3879/m.12310 type:complete len:226 (-) Transcript_3879:1482-2159(-)
MQHRFHRGWVGRTLHPVHKGNVSTLTRVARTMLRMLLLAVFWLGQAHPHELDEGVTEAWCGGGLAGHHQDVEPLHDTTVLEWQVSDGEVLDRHIPRTLQRRHHSTARRLYLLLCLERLHVEALARGTACTGTGPFWPHFASSYTSFDKQRRERNACPRLALLCSAPRSRRGARGCNEESLPVCLVVDDTDGNESDRRWGWRRRPHWPRGGVCAPPRRRLSYRYSC